MGEAEGGDRSGVAAETKSGELGRGENKVSNLSLSSYTWDGGIGRIVNTINLCGAGLKIDEGTASYYLEQTRGDLKRAFLLYKEDLAWETKNPVGILPLREPNPLESWLTYQQATHSKKITIQRENDILRYPHMHSLPHCVQSNTEADLYTSIWYYSVSTEITQAMCIRSQILLVLHCLGCVSVYIEHKHNFVCLFNVSCMRDHRLIAYLNQGLKCSVEAWQTCRNLLRHWFPLLTWVSR